MMKLFCMVLLAGSIFCGSARSGVRMVDVVEDMMGDESFIRTLETIVSQVKDSVPCKKIAEQLNRKADRQEKSWREAFMSGSPTTQEWCRLAHAEVLLFRKLAESRKQEKKDEEIVSLSKLEDDGVITHEEAEELFAALRRLLWMSKTAIDSLDGFTAGAELPLPSSPDGDSYEKLLAWKLNPHSSLSYVMDHGPLVNGGLEEAERFSRLPPLTPEQWCWLQKREHDREALERSVGDTMIIALMLWKEGDEKEDNDPLMEETFRYWVAAPERAAQVWQEKLRKEKGR